MLKSLIRSKTARKIMGVLFLNPDEKFYIRQLERLIDEPVSAVRRELNNLEKSGLLASEDSANVKHYWANRKSPIYEEIKAIILKTQAIGDTLRGPIKEISGIKAAFIYGSVAKNEEKKTSDIDLMIIGDVDSVKLHSRMSEIENNVKRAINYTLISVGEFRHKKTDFLKRVLQDKKVFLIGTENDLK